MENLRFEESFKEAFDRAEIAPSRAVWANVELGLEKTSGGNMRGRLLFFQLLAAASMVFAMGIGGIYYLNTNHEEAQPIALQKSNNALKDQSKEAMGDKLSIINQSVTNEDKSYSVNKNNQRLSAKNMGNALESESLASVDPSESKLYSETPDEVSFISGKRPLPKLVVLTEPRIRTSTSEPDPGMMLLAKLRDEEKKYQQDKPEEKEKLWASLGMGAGTYKPNARASIGNMNGLSGADSPSAPTSDPSSGTSYSVGVSVAGKVSNRIVLQCGISYLTQNSTYTSSTASVMGEASLNEYAKASINGGEALANQLTATSPYQVNSNLQYLSIPLQAGYIIIDRDFAVQINGGISTDIFFKNTLTPENSDIVETTQGAGSDSPYRTLNFSGLLGTELSYKVGDHYRIAVNPGMRYALNSIYKSEIVAENSPITLDVSLRFRYLF